MKKVCFFTLFFALFLVVDVNAQQLLSGDRVLTSEGMEVIGMYLEEEPMKLDPKTDKLSLEVMDFGDKGTTFVVSYELNSLKGEIGESYKGTAFWSGRNYKLMYQGEAGNKGYFVVDGVSRGFVYASIYTKTDGKNALIAKFLNKSKMITGIYKGMTLAELTKATSGLHCKSEFSHKSGNLDVYSFKIPSMKDVWNGREYISKVTHKEYGQFYFNAQGQLVKWLITN